MKQAIIILLIILGCSPKLHAQSDSLRIVQHLKTITKTDGYRNYKNVSLLNQTAEYIFSVFQQYADTVFYQPYQVNGVTYKNVICRLGNAHKKPLVVVGAHYDVCGNQEGATGNIIYQEQFNIAIGEKIENLKNKAIEIGTKLMIKALCSIEHIQSTPQPASSPTIRARNVFDYNELIDWEEWSVERIWHIVNGLSS